MKVLDVIVMILLVVGGLNWGIVGISDVNVVEMIFGAGMAITRVIYILVGLAALYEIFLSKSIIDRWKKAG